MGPAGLTPCDVLSVPPGSGPCQDVLPASAGRSGGVLCGCPEAEGIPVVFWVSHGVTVYPTARWEVTGRLDIVGAHSCPGREARGGRADRPGHLWPGPSWHWCSQPGSPTFLAPGIGFVEDNFSTD